MCNVLSFDYSRDDPFTRWSLWPRWPSLMWFSGKRDWDAVHIYWLPLDKRPVHWFPYCSPRSHCGNRWEDENRGKSSREELKSCSNSLVEMQEISIELRPQRNNISSSFFCLPNSNPNRFRELRLVISGWLVKEMLFWGYQHQPTAMWHKCQFWNLLALLIYHVKSEILIRKCLHLHLHLCI